MPSHPQSEYNTVARWIDAPLRRRNVYFNATPMTSMVDHMEDDQQKRWNDTYAANKDFFGDRPSEFGLRAADWMKVAGAKDILELGCGQGRDTLLFLKRGFAVTALDYSSNCLEQVRKAAEGASLQTNLNTMQNDLRQGLPFPDASFDAVYSHMLFTMRLTESELEAAFKEVLRVLRPGGLNIYSVRNVHDPHYQKGKHMGEDMWQNPLGFVVHFFSEEKIRRMAFGAEVVLINEFEDTSPPFTKKLYEVILRKP
jgi:ubiquinone/menaquinone biosynthesis C-methylase UbiE